MWQNGLAHAHDRAYVEAEKISANVYWQIRDRREIMAYLAARPEIVEPSSRQCNDTLKLYQQTFPDMAAVTIRSTSGEPLCSSWPNPRRHLNPIQSHWIAEGVKAGDFHVSDAVIGPTSGRWVIALTYPLRDRAGRTKSILIFAVDLMKMSQRLLPGTFGHAAVTITDRSFHVIMRNRQLADLIGRPLPPHITGVLRSQREGTFRAPDLYGLRRVGAFVTVPMVNWTIADGYPENEVLAPTIDKIKTASLICLCVIIALFFIAFTIYRNIVRYTRTLAEAAERVERGDFGARAACDGPKELALVAQQFNQMLDSLQERNADLVSVNAALTEIIEAMRKPLKGGRP